MLSKKILIAALTLALCATAFTSCGRNVDTESDVSDTGSVTESQTKETETKAPETSYESTGMATSDTIGTTETEKGETAGSDIGSDSTVIPDGGDIVGRIGEDVQNGMGNVKRGVEDFFDGDGTAPHAQRSHRGRVPYGK